MQCNPYFMLLALIYASTAIAVAVPRPAAGPAAGPAQRRPAPNKAAAAFDVDSIQNKVRSGAIAIANSQRPVDERNQRVQYRNGDLVDTTVVEAPEYWEEEEDYRY